MISYITSQIDYVYDNFLDIIDITNITQNVSINIFNSKNHYMRYGDLWNISVDNGGYTDLKNNSIVSYVYKDNDYEIKNLGHEVHHSLFYVLKKKNIFDLPLWFIEGSAESQSKPPCYYGKTDFIKKYINTIKLRDILKGSYKDAGLVYYMGSSLFDFLLKKNKDIFFDIFNGKYKNDSYLNHLDNKFYDWNVNLLEECKLFDSIVSLDSSIIKSIPNAEILFDYCNDKIFFEFDDIAFILNRKEIFKIRKRSKNNLSNYLNDIYNNTEPIIINNEIIIFENIKQSDYEWFINKLLIFLFKKTIISLNAKYNINTFLTDNLFYIYDNKTNNLILTCKNNNYLDKNSLLPSLFYIIKESAYYDDLFFFNNVNDYNEFIKKVELIIYKEIDCPLVIKPSTPLSNLNKDLTNLVYSINRNDFRFNNYIPDYFNNIIVDYDNNTIVDLINKHKRMKKFNYLCYDNDNVKKRKPISLSLFIKRKLYKIEKDVLTNNLAIKELNKNILKLLA